MSVVKSRNEARHQGGISRRAVAAMTGVMIFGPLGLWNAWKAWRVSGGHGDPSSDLFFGALGLAIAVNAVVWFLAPKRLLEAHALLRCVIGAFFFVVTVVVLYRGLGILM